MATYWTSQYGTKIDISGLDAATLKRVKELANTKYGTKATEIANAYRKANPTSTTTNNTAATNNNTTTNNTTTTTTTTENPKQTDPNSIAGSIVPNAQGLLPQDVSAIERAKGMIDIGEQFGRRVGNEFYYDGSLGRQDENLSPEELAAMARVKEFASRAGLQSADVAALLQQQKDILGEARQLSALEQEAIGLTRNQLGGLAAPEMEALRSQARANIQGQSQAAMRDLAKNQARNQVFGSAALAQRRLVGQDTVRETRNLERDLLVKNIDIKLAAQNAFNNLVTSTEGARAGRTNAASGMLANTTLTDENQRKGAEATAIGQQGTLATTLGDRLRSLKEYNLTQAASERAGRLGSIFGGIGTITDQRGLLAGEEFTDKQYEESKGVRDEIFKILRESLSKQKQAL